MIHSWFETKIRYSKMMENGVEKKVTELYLVDALSCTEAEARATEEVSPYISGEFNISSVKQAKYSDERLCLQSHQRDAAIQRAKENRTYSRA